MIKLTSEKAYDGAKVRARTAYDTVIIAALKAYDEGMKSILESERKLAFAKGVKHIVTLAEGFLVKELELTSRDALVESGKIPAWWVATLVADYAEKPQDNLVFEDLGELEL